ncbi:hypothetical protein EVJ58_g7380 [Rhodofomes roseus]|uniref:Uncharacterized protein n=1 Tax=Rhodofomes roseus TaxID=34475 RepID=A0A4Y9Y416_9APHY|nr:hypothetical protein EVJ58_g7380 [Rhodofomes roseus]
MADALNAEEESLLQSALQTAFTPVPLPKQSAVPEQPAPAPEPAQPVPAQEEAAGAPAPASPAPESTEDVWKADYDAHVAEWRRTSAEQRERAEGERARWEEIRKKEREEAKARGSARSEGWESVGGSTSASMVLDATASTSTAASVGGEAGGEPSVADARDLVSGEGQGRKTKEELEQAILPGSHAQARSRFSTPPDASSEAEHKWEDIHSSDPDSLASSYPSLSFPSDPHSPSSSLPHPLPPHAHHGHAHHPAHPHGHEHAHEQRREAPSTTQALFDSVPLAAHARPRARREPRGEHRPPVHQRRHARLRRDIRKGGARRLARLGEAIVELVRVFAGACATRGRERAAPGSGQQSGISLAVR